MFNLQQASFSKDTRILVRLAAVGALLALSACADYEPRSRPRISAPPPSPAVSAQVFFYPSHGQNAQQQDRDHYECYQWAVKQTNFDPNLAPPAPPPPVVVTPLPPPGRDTAVGALAGAAIGATVAGRHERAEGAVIGAIAGAALGAASDTARQNEAARVQEHIERQQTVQGSAQSERKVLDFRRAMSACLEGRGYTVR